MSLTDAQLFAMWGPRCSGKSAEVSLYGHGVVTVAPAIIPAVRSLNACLIAWRYETRAADTGAFNLIESFAGESAVGTWTLQVIDRAPNDEGTLDAWTLSVYCE